jgi:cell shape-determining protein MreC
VAVVTVIDREEGRTFARVEATPLAALDRGREVLLISLPEGLADADESQQAEPDESQQAEPDESQQTEVDEYEGPEVPESPPETDSGTAEERE